VGEALGGLAGVTSHEAMSVDGRVRVQLDATDEHELRPEIFRLARDRGWTLWELHRERASLEQLFRSLTTEGVPGAAQAGASEAEPSGAETSSADAEGKA
jgi:hypothetical protein